MNICVLACVCVLKAFQWNMFKKNDLDMVIMIDVL